MSYRYTLWVHTALDGTPEWSPPVAEEFYDERPGNAGNYDQSERHNIFGPSMEPLIAPLRAALRAKTLR